MTVRVRLADSVLELEPESDDVGGPDEIVPAFGGTMRDGLGVRAGRGGVELAVLGGLVVDPVLGVRRASIGITSHLHLFEVNRALELDRRTAWGRHLDIHAGEKVHVAPGQTVTVRTRPFGGARVIRGHSELVDGRLDEPGALEAALQRGRELGYKGM